MSNTKESEKEVGGLDRDLRMAVLFTGLVMNQTQMALMLLGKLPNPATGETVKDLDGAQLFIDQLEMLEVKTRGNLGEQEKKLLREQLTALRMAFVEATTGLGAPSKAPTGAETAGSPGESARQSEGAREGAAPEPTPPVDADSRKKFSKKY